MADKATTLKEIKKIIKAAEQDSTPTPTLHPAYLSLGKDTPDEVLRPFHQKDVAQISKNHDDIAEYVKTTFEISPFKEQKEAQQAYYRLRDLQHNILVNCSNYYAWKLQQGDLLKKWGDQERIDSIDYNKYSCVPQQGDWITFPLRDPGDKVVVPWTDGFTIFEATYYKTTCWWGKLILDVSKEGLLKEVVTTKKPDAAADNKDKVDKVAQVNDQDKTEKSVQVDKDKAKKLLQESTTDAINRISTGQARMQTYGETDLFIAAEFIEKRYMDGPHLRYGHLLNRFQIKKEQSNRNEQTGHDNQELNPWAYLRLNEMFQYGQDKAFENANFRFLVYHPFHRPRKIPQFHFVDNKRRSIPQNIVESMKNNSFHPISFLGILLSSPIALLSDVLKDPLHSFEVIHPLNSPYVEIINADGIIQDKKNESLSPVQNEKQVFNALVIQEKDVAANQTQRQDSEKLIALSKVHGISDGSDVRQKLLDSFIRTATDPQYNEEDMLVYMKTTLNMAIQREAVKRQETRKQQQEATKKAGSTKHVETPETKIAAAGRKSLSNLESGTAASTGILKTANNTPKVTDTAHHKYDPISLSG